MLYVVIKQKVLRGKEHKGLNRLRVTSNFNLSETLYLQNSQYTDFVFEIFTCSFRCNVVADWTVAFFYPWLLTPLLRFKAWWRFLLSSVIAIVLRLCREISPYAPLLMHISLWRLGEWTADLTGRCFWFWIQRRKWLLSLDRVLGDSLLDLTTLCNAGFLPQVFVRYWIQATFHLFSWASHRFVLIFSSQLCAHFDFWWNEIFIPCSISLREDTYIPI